MLTFRYVRQTRSSFCPLSLSFLYSTEAPESHPAASIPSSYLFQPTSSSSSSSPRSISVPEKDLILPFKEWFLSSRNPLFDAIFEILNTQEGPALDATLCRFNLLLSESLVLDILGYGKSRNKVLACLKFFDWAGRQGGFYHTRATFHAMFQILSKKKLMWLMLQFLDKYFQKKYVYQVRYYDTLVIGYAVAGKIETALHVFGKMRFSGIDLDRFAYHVLLNSMVEQGHFDVVDMVVEQMQLRGVVDEVSHSIILKSFCKQNNLDRAEEYLHNLMADSGNGEVGSTGILVGNLVDDLCKDRQFERASELVKLVRTLGTASMEQGYGVWVKNLVRAGNLDGALEFLRSKKEVDGYVPNIHVYNVLVYSLLRQNRLADMLDLLIEMKVEDMFPNEVTMNGILCFFCRAGMVDTAMELYESSAELGLSVNRMAYNSLMQSLFGDNHFDKAYALLEASIKEGHYPEKETLSIIEKHIPALCGSQRVIDVWSVFDLLKSLNIKARKSTYSSLIRGLYKEGKGDIAANLFMEMQLKGHKPSLELFRAVIHHLCEMADAEKHYFRLLHDQLSRYEPRQVIFNCFIDGAGHAEKSELAKQVYDMMVNSKIKPSVKSDILLLQSYLKSGKIAYALNFFDDLSKRRVIRRKLWEAIIIGLCKVGKADLALEKFWKMRAGQQKPSFECYEELVKALCNSKQYATAFKIIDDLQRIGRPISSFIGNTILLHSLKSREIYHDWRSLTNLENLTPGILKLGNLIHVFLVSMQGEEDVKNVEEHIRQCFPLDLYTYNLLLRRLSITRMSYAWEYFKKFHEKGCKPNRWTYEIVARGLLKFGRVEEAKRLMEEMFNKGFDLTEPRLPYSWEDL